jgi:hypothetical protein
VILRVVDVMEVQKSDPRLLHGRNNRIVSTIATYRSDANCKNKLNVGEWWSDGVVSDEH